MLAKDIKVKESAKPKSGKDQSNKALPKEGNIEQKADDKKKKTEVKSLKETKAEEDIPSELREIRKEKFKATYPKYRAYKFDKKYNFTALITLYTRCFFDSLAKSPLNDIKKFHEEIKYNAGKYWTISDEAGIKVEFLKAIKEVKKKVSEDEQLEEWPKDKVEHCESFITKSLEKYLEDKKNNKLKREVDKKRIKDIKTFNEETNELFKLDIIWTDTETINEDYERKPNYFIYPTENRWKVFYRKNKKKKKGEHVLLKEVFKCLAKTLKDSSKSEGYFGDVLKKNKGLEYDDDTKEIFEKYRKECSEILKNNNKALKKEEIIVKKQVEGKTCMACMRTDKIVFETQSVCNKKCSLCFCESCFNKVNEIFNCIL